MKLIIGLIIIAFINLINAQIIVNTTFTVAKCTNPYSPTFTIDECLSYCGESGSHIIFSYDFKNEQYLATTYQDNWCEDETKQFAVECPISVIDNTYSVLCSNPVSVLNFNQFTVTGSKCPSSGANIQLNKCSSSCDGKYSTVSKVPGQVNRYNIAFSDTSDCKGETKVYPLYCGSNNEQYTLLSGDGVVCQNSTATIPTQSEEEANSNSNSTSDGSNVYSLIGYSTTILLSVLLLIL